MTLNEASAFTYGNKIVIYLFLSVGLVLSTDFGFFPAALPQIREYFRISYAQGGILGSVYYFAFALSSPVYGWLANSIPPVKIALVGIIL